MLEARKQPVLYGDNGYLIAQSGNDNKSVESFDMYKDTSEWFYKKENNLNRWSDSSMDRMSIPLTCVRNVRTNELANYNKYMITDSPKD